MKSKEDKLYEKFEASFPSDTFLDKHYGSRGVRREDYAYLRHVFQSVLVGGIMITVRDYEFVPNKAAHVPIYVFQDGLFTDFVYDYGDKIFDADQEFYGSPEAQSELLKEFTYWYERGVLYQDIWWRWRVNETSIWVEVIPGALQEYIRNPPPEDVVVFEPPDPLLQNKKRTYE